MILDKAKMAHDWAIKYGKVDSNHNRENTVQLAWEYADAMQAEADKRVVKLHDVFFDTKQNEEWQPDWSRAPDGYDWWAMDKDMKNAFWFDFKPFIHDKNCITWKCRTHIDKWDKAPSFGYQGNWQDSLRKRP